MARSPISELMRDRRVNWRAIAFLASAVLLVAAALFVFLPEHRSLILLGLYAIVAHVFVVSVPMEPAVLFYAKDHSPLVVALLATNGSIISGFFDYLLLVPLLHHRLIRPKYEARGFYVRAHEFFMASPFLWLVLGHATPILYYPFKVLAIAGRYDFVRFTLAAFVGRLPRYYVLAFFGALFPIPNWALLLLTFALVGAYAGKELVRKFRPPAETESAPK